MGGGWRFDFCLLARVGPVVGTIEYVYQGFFWGTCTGWIEVDPALHQEVVLLGEQGTGPGAYLVAPEGPSEVGI